MQSVCLSSVRQGPRETAAELAVRVEDMVLQGKWPDTETQNCRIDLYYKATAYYEIQRYIQDQTSREGNELTWEKLVQEAKRQERMVLEYKDFKMDAGNTGSTPTYDNPALNADAMGKFTRGWLTAKERQGRQHWRCMQKVWEAGSSRRLRLSCLQKEMQNLWQAQSL